MKLERVIEIAGYAGHRHGVAVWPQGAKFVAAVLDSEGRISDPRSFSPRDTTEDALTDLAVILGNKCRTDKNI